MTHDIDPVEFDDLITVAFARVSVGDAPRAGLRQQLLARVTNPPVPTGFVFRLASEPDWLPHPVPGIKMKVLAMNHARGYATLLLDVAAGTHFPEHFHSGAEECFVVSGSLYTCDRRMDAGDFLHADADTDHGELWTEEGCRVILVVPPEDYMPDPAVFTPQ